MPAPVPVPASFDDLTAAWFQAALGRPGIRSVGVEPLGAGVGLLGDLARVRLVDTDGQGPMSVIVKLPTADPGGHQVGAMLRAWAREHAFYTEVAPASPGARLPLCLHSGADEHAGRWVLVLEDCPADRVDPEHGASRAQAEAAVDALAGFHATWWQSDRRFRWMPGFDTTGVGGLEPAWLDAHPRFLRRYAHVVPEPTERWLDGLAPWLGPWSDRAAAEPLTVVHADYRLDNLLLHDGQVTMIDWQTALRGPGTMDLTSFLATGLAVEDRRQWEDDLIDAYRSGLAHRGCGIDPAWLARSYDETLLWWMGQFANNLARLEPEDPAVQRALDTMIHRTFTAAADHDAGRLLSRR